MLSPRHTCDLLDIPVLLAGLEYRILDRRNQSHKDLKLPKRPGKNNSFLGYTADIEPQLSSAGSG